MQNEKLAVIALVVIIAVALSGYLLATYWDDIFDTTDNDVIEGGLQIGDCADVNYIGRFQSNNSIFDTSYKDIAEDEGIYNELRPYEPLNIFVNPNLNLTVPEGYSNYTYSMIQGFLEGLVGMEKGETKIVTIPADKGYGIWNESLAKDYGLSPYPVSSVMDFEWDFERSLFQQYFPDTNISINNSFDWGEQMIGIADTITATITKVNDTNVTYLLDPKNGTSFTMPLFEWDVTIIIENTTSFTLKTDTYVGFITSIDLGYGFLHMKVVGLNETDINLAVNTDSPDLKFIGETLEFTLTVEEVYKTSQKDES
jgi:FKBP-type peptidyl-prolyl cis-trans isomerase 2